MKLPSSLFRNLGLPDPARSRLPPRVSDLIALEEARSERLISWVQLALVTVFGTLYAISPRPLDADAGMIGLEPVPIALSSYTAFTLLRLWLSYRCLLPGWYLILSTVADVVMLYGLIWSFHIAYGQPPSFSLKVPTYAYIFVFITIRALRVDPRFVITQGVLAALGWAAIVALTVAEEGSGAITRSFVSYLTDNRVLIGAELDKILTLITVTFVLALALARSRRTLVQAVREGVASREMRRYFGAGVADAITMRDTAAMAGEAEGRDAAILMLDLRGFSRFAEANSPQDVVAALTAYHSLVVPIVEHHGGIVDKFLGDGVMATFGAVRPSPTAAADALNALCAIVAATPDWRTACAGRGLPTLPINGSAAAGRVVAATLGSEMRLEFTVIGAPANLAAKLEKHNKVVSTVALTTEATYALACAQGFDRDLPRLGPSVVAGVDEPLHLRRIET